MLQHQQKAKYCLDIQGSFSKYECDFCKKRLCSNERLLTHHKICKEYQKKEHENNLNNSIEKLKKELSEKYEEKMHYQKKEYEEKIIEQKEEYEQKIKKQKEEFDKKLKERMIPLGERINSAIEDVKEINDYLEYSKMTVNNVIISARPFDHYINATELCQAGEKNFNDWYRLDTTKELIQQLSNDLGIVSSLLVETKKCNRNGPWIHPDLSIQLAQWISPKFSLQVSKWIRTLFSKETLQIDLNILKEKEQRIKQLESVCLSKKRREEYPERNVIYLLTTDDHLKRRTYIIGKAKNLTTRLGTYNKTCDHAVVYYRECKSEEDMDTVETLVIAKLKPYREQANRDRFILPEDKGIEFFKDAIDQSISFIA